MGGELLSYYHLDTCLDYMAKEVITAYENNIKQHFVEYVERFVNVFWCKNEKIELIKVIFIMIPLLQ